MPNKEAILEKHRKHILTITDRDAILTAMDEYAKEIAVGFFKWNALQAAEYLDYLRRVDQADGTSEKEKEAYRFENSTIDGRYEMYIQQLNP